MPHLGWTSVPIQSSMAHVSISGVMPMWLSFSCSSCPTLAYMQEALAPILLRRMKEDVETLPEKEEVIIWVELTREQRAYYSALYAKQIGALLGGASNKNLPNMKNLAMELRKLCCHPVSAGTCPTSDRHTGI